MRGPLQHTDEWHAAKRTLITSTDIASILGINPYASEGDVARHKQGEPDEEPDDATARRLRLGLAMEDVVAHEDEIEHGIKLRHVRRMIISDSLPWAGTSMDFERIGERCIVEIKTSSSSDWSNGLPERVEVQVRWQMGVAGYPRAHVAVLRWGNQLECYDLEHDEEVFQNLIIIAEDFRARLAVGGPFDETKESIRRAYRRDDGTEVVAGPDETNAVGILLDVRRRKDELDEKDGQIVKALMQRMGPASVMVGPNFRITWKQNKPSRKVQWEQIANGLLATLSESDREAVLSLNTIKREGSRPFKIKETE